MNELERIRQQKMAEFQRGHDEQEQFQSQLDGLEAQIRPLMTKDALTRYGTLKLAYPDKAATAIVMIARAVEAGKVSRIDDNTLKELLKALRPKKRDISITHK